MILKEVDTKNTENNTKLQDSLHGLKDVVNNKIAELETKLNNMNLKTGDDTNDQQVEAEVVVSDGKTDLGWVKAVLDLKNKMHKNCNTLRFLCSEPLSVQWSVWYKGDFKIEKGESEDIVPFNWVNCNAGGAVVDGNKTQIKSLIYISHPRSSV